MQISTTHLKIQPIRRKVRELAGLTGRRSPDRPVVTQVIGISLDEAHRMRDSDPAGWERAVAYDELARHAGPAFGGRGITGEAYVHFSGRPLAQVDLSTEEDRGQLSLFGSECQGMCGV